MTKKLLLFTLISFSLFLNAQQSYYNDVDLTKSGIDLKEELATKITNTHTNFLTYTPDVWDASKVTDLDPNNSDNVLLIYGYNDTDGNTLTDRSRDKDNNGGNNGTDWNREHTYPRSLGNPNLGTSGPGADAHHLRPSDVDFNSDRGSLAFVNSTGNAKAINGGWYPGDEWKGDVARMMMYMYLRYGDQCLPSVVGIGDNSSTPDDMIDLFLTWNAEDPVSQIEDNRNTYHENTSNSAAQGNRNPFIDNPNLATQIWGGTVAQNRWDPNAVNDTDSPSTVTNLSASDITDKSLTLSWNVATDNIGVIAYQVFVDGSLDSVTGTNGIILDNLQANTTYSIYVLAVDAAGNTSNTNTPIQETTLTEVIDNTVFCITEDFENIGSSSSSYTDVTWTGSNGLDWDASDARTDQTLSDGSKAITLRDGSLNATTSNGGIGSLSVKTQRVFGGGTGILELYVNRDLVGDIPFSGDEQTITINDINIEGAVQISIINISTTGDRVIIDDLKWECYDAATASINDNNLFNLNIYPNPSNTGKVTIQQNSNIESITNITVYSVIGKEIIKINNPEFINNSLIIDNLKKGMYLMKVSNDSKSTTKKIIIN